MQWDKKARVRGNDVGEAARGQLCRALQVIARILDFILDVMGVGIRKLRAGK